MRNFISLFVFQCILNLAVVFPPAQAESLPLVDVPLAEIHVSGSKETVMLYCSQLNETNNCEVYKLATLSGVVLVGNIDRSKLEIAKKNLEDLYLKYDSKKLFGWSHSLFVEKTETIGKTKVDPVSGATIKEPREISDVAHFAIKYGPAGIAVNACVITVSAFEALFIAPFKFLKRSLIKARTKKAYAVINTATTPLNAGHSQPVPVFEFSKKSWEYLKKSLN